ETSSTLKFKIEFNPNPYQITENTHWGGQIFLEQNVIIDNGATLTINPGTTVYMGYNVQIVSKPGTKILVNGTDENRVVFKRLNSSEQWTGIWLQGDESSINYAELYGGRNNIMVQSSGNT